MRMQTKHCINTSLTANGTSETLNPGCIDVHVKPRIRRGLQTMVVNLRQSAILAFVIRGLRCGFFKPSIELIATLSTRVLD